MRKFFTFIFLILVAVLAASPYVVGMKVEEAVATYLAQIDDIPFYQVEASSYERGYLSSKVIVTLGVEEEFVEAISQDAPNISVETTDFFANGLDLILDVQHGPVLTMHGYGVGWTDMQILIDRATYPEMGGFFDAIDDDRFMQWSMRVDIPGSGWVKTEISNIDAQIEEEGEEVQIVLQGAQGITSFSNFGAYMESEGGIEEFLLEVQGEEPLSMGLTDLQFEGDFTALDSIWMGLGAMEARIAEANFASADTRIKASDLGAHVAVTQGSSNQTLSIRESFTIENADMNGYEVNDIEFAFAYKNISRAILEAYMSDDSMVGISDPEEMNARMMATYKPLLEQNLRFHPEIAIETLGFESDSGLLESNASIAIDSSKLGANIDLDNPLALLPALTAFGDLDISETLLRSFMVFKTKSDMAQLPQEQQMSDEQIAQSVDMQLAMGLGMLEQRGFVVKEGDVYSTTFSFADGVPALNGKPVPLLGF